jgi:hypothetical protein
MLLLLLAAHLTAQAQTQFEWRDASGNVRSLADLEEILRKHRQWTQSAKQAGAQADLTHADLSVSGGANLIKANLGGADLTDAFLADANLTNAHLRDANLTDANLPSANLTGAVLTGANLTGAWVAAVNFNRAIFEPNSLPMLRGISRAQNLELLTYDDNPAALVQLRKQFEDGGLREQERKITYALKRREAELSWERGTPSAQRRVERISPLSTTHSPGPRWLFQFFRREALSYISSVSIRSVRLGLA